MERPSSAFGALSNAEEEEENAGEFKPEDYVPWCAFPALSTHSIATVH
jgi:hypothetical protein